MNEQVRSAILNTFIGLGPEPQAVKWCYGTAGFRGDASLLESTVYRAGILAALRALKTQSSVGLMITASHNVISDNGVKIADPSGCMMSREWEPFADAMANARGPHEFLRALIHLTERECITSDNPGSALVLLGRDTRPSGQSLIEVAKRGINTVIFPGFIDMGVLTTPQLHWMVRAKNRGLKSSELDYYEDLSSSFKSLMSLSANARSVCERGLLVVDAANGVGALKLRELTKLLDVALFELRNCGGGVLNESVGADFVQKERTVPLGFGGGNDVGKRCVSLDGDADRFVYFTVESDGTATLIDGDKILSLFALFVCEQLRTVAESDGEWRAPSVGVVQTAYANGASTSYLKRQPGLEAVTAPTGVKFLHEKALEYDVGIYFEANGHGTVLFSDRLVGRLEAAAGGPDGRCQDAVSRLLAVRRLMNQAVGDALSGLLMAEAVLAHLGWSVHRWDRLYRDLPSRHLKVEVPDRTSVVTGSADTVVVRPVGIQEAIDAEVARHAHGRCFVRPSGTEDVIRVYAEALTQESADHLASSVKRLLHQFLPLST